jgi:hypothetical protein
MACQGISSANVPLQSWHNCRRSSASCELQSRQPKGRQKENQQGKRTKATIEMGCKLMFLLCDRWVCSLPSPLKDRVLSNKKTKCLSLLNLHCGAPLLPRDAARSPHLPHQGSHFRNLTAAVIINPLRTASSSHPSCTAPPPRLAAAARFYTMLPCHKAHRTAPLRLLVVVALRRRPTFHQLLRQEISHLSCCSSSSSIPQPSTAAAHSFPTYPSSIPVWARSESQCLCAPRQTPPHQSRSKMD